MSDKKLTRHDLLWFSWF